MGMGRKKNKNEHDDAFTDAILKSLISGLPQDLIDEVAAMRNVVQEKIPVEHVLHLLQDHSYLIEGDDTSVYLALSPTHYIQIELEDMWVEPITEDDGVVVPFKKCDPE